MNEEQKSTAGTVVALALVAIAMCVVGTLFIFGAGQATGVGIFGFGEYVSYKLTATTPPPMPPPPSDKTSTQKSGPVSDPCVEECKAKTLALRGEARPMDEPACAAACDGVRK